MKSETISIQQLFQDRRQYRVPFFQRQYVWNKEDQWERLWGDISAKADVRIDGGQPPPHFLGATVLEPESNLHLNRMLMRLEKWDEADIEYRGQTMFEVAVKTWPGPGT